jgi:TolB-like protein/predicted Ser/Thr protein kinase
VVTKVTAEGTDGGLVGKQLGAYKISGLLGVGGMGEVYRAEDTRLGRTVAVKVLPTELAQDKDRLHRFVREARAASALNHANVAHIYDIGESGGFHFIAMEYVEGQSLAQKSNGQPLELGEVLDVGSQAADALAEAHEKGIIHRDIKSANLMITPKGRLKVLDFGLAKITGPEGEGVGSDGSTSLHTSEGRVMGTLGYMSPEQVLGKDLDARTDLFSLGVLLYEMTTGRLPFSGSQANEVMDRILHGQPEAMARFNYDVPAELERIVRKCLEKDRERRYQLAREVWADLSRLKEERAAKTMEPVGKGIAKPRASLRRPVEVAAADEIETRLTGETATGQVHGTAIERNEQAFDWLKHHKFSVALALTLLLVTVAAAVYFSPLGRHGQTIKSLAVLPLKSLDAGENYLGLGIADAVIRRINQTGKLIVRPTSAVRRYLKEDTDALIAAGQLKADAVLEGNVQRAGDRLRVSVNLLRAGDGASLWADNFDMGMTDIFTIQDTVAQQVASRLRLQLDSSHQAQLTSNPVAYDFYMKGVYNLDQRLTLGNPQWKVTIDFFKKAIEADRNFALAHAQLALAYATVAVFVETTDPVWAERAREETNQAQALDPKLAETHLARQVLLYSRYEGFQGEAAARELLLAQQLNPNVGHAQLGYVYTHLGLEDLAARVLERALEIDPTSQFAKGLTVGLYEMSGKYDEFLAAHQRFYPNEPTPARYFLWKGRLAEAQKAIETEAVSPSTLFGEFAVLLNRALLFALKGDFRSAEKAIPSILSRHPVKDPFYHHAAYDIACIYALEGKSVEAVRWLREAAATGFRCYPLFERDAFLNNIRQKPEFIQFMAEMKAQHDRYRREFS